ncbi:uncharacterized protein LOC108144309 [Drosophila elegans]|uniref:uncharacterized protein LOC108144309 n=1 Tax=Drosophila elegans TaxID=30023 RepID=UPI0007E652F1|nr:uncharacterized protein LOC108144309 [Drosophila elegans]
MFSAGKTLVGSQAGAKSRKSRLQTIRRILNTIRLNSCLYFFSLEKGCRIIATFEALVSVVQICSFYHLGNQSSASAIFPDPYWVTKIDRDGIIKRLFLYRTNPNFQMGLALVTVLNSMLLFIGSKWGHQVCLFLWIYISLFTTLMTNVNDTMRNINVTQVLSILPSLATTTYFLIVVASLICKFQTQSDDFNSGITVLSSEDEEL